jgi:subtilisin family serine protease
MSLLKLFDLFTDDESYSKKRVNDFDLLSSKKFDTKEKVEDSNLPSSEKLYINEKVNDFDLPSLDKLHTNEKVEDFNLLSLEKFDYKTTSKSQEQVETSVASIAYENKTDIGGEVVPWGVSAVWRGEDIVKRGNFASDTYAFVIDSGVSNATGDINFASNTSWHRSWISGESPFTDVNGHGTHVAGTIGALVNGKGIVGVAPGAQIISLKVNNDSGFGSDTVTIEAINYAVSVINNNNLDKSKVVINLSVNGIFSSRLDSTIKNAADQGIRFAISAGNNGKDADGYSPASAGDHPNVFTVSAVNSSYQMPSWSNWDRIDSTDGIDDVDFAAPGVNVLSYYKNGELAYLSGTSMAAAHVSGLLITGGVQEGNYVTPSHLGTADPFAISSTKTFVPSTYTVVSDNTIDEEKTLKVDVVTTNVTQGTSLYWKISGTGINLKDFVGLSDLSGSLAVGSDGTASINLGISGDKITEGTEVFNFELFSDSNRSIKVGEKSVNIQDTSKTPLGVTLWGTSGSDVLTGTAGNDRISGVMASGTSQASMGVGQIDVLTGGSGADVFVLGDSRGVFYNDGIKNNLGVSDHALITDFTRGEDKLQLTKGFSYILGVSDGNLSLYLDLNRNRNLESFGSNQDELIAVLQGVTTLTNSDLILV